MKRQKPRSKRSPAKTRKRTSTPPRRRQRSRSTPSPKRFEPPAAWKGYYRRRRDPGCGALPDPPPAGTHAIGPDDYDDDDN